MRDAEGGQVVARVYYEIGNRRIVIMPDGSLKSLLLDQAQPTDQLFVPATKEQLVKQYTGGSFSGFKLRTTTRFAYVYNTSEGFYTATSRILETMFPGVLAYFKRQKGITVHEPEVPLVLLMFKTEKEFQAYHPMPEGVVAYYNAVSNQVVMYEQSELVEVAPELAFKQSISTIAHEGIHQILHNIGVQQRLSDWPMWISEGLPEYFAPTSTDKRMRWKGVGTVNDFRMYELSEYLKSRPRGQAPGALVRRAVESAQFNSLDYATSWAMTHFLAERNKEQLLAYVREVSKNQPFADRNLGARRVTSSASAEQFAKYFGSDYAKLEEDLIKYLKKLPYSDPIENQTHYAAMFVVDRGTSVGRSAAVTSSPAAVREWQDQILAEMPPAMRSRVKFQVQAFPTRTQASSFVNQWLEGR